MNARRWTLVALCALAACSEDKLVGTRGEPTGEEPRPPRAEPPIGRPPRPRVAPPPGNAPRFEPPPRLNPSAPQSSVFQLLIRGENGSGFDAALFGISTVAILVDGKPVPTRIRDDMSFDLAQTQTAWLLADFELPPGSDQAEIQVQLDRFGGFARGAEAGAVDARIPPWRFKVKRADLQQRGHVVVHLNLGQSLVATGDRQRTLIPTWEVRY